MRSTAPAPANELEPADEPGLLAGGDHGLALGVGAGHRLFHVNRLARSGGAQRIVHVESRWCGHVHGIDLGIVDQRLGVVGPARHVVAAGVILGQRAIAAHHGDQG